MAVAKVIVTVADEVRARIAARNAEISVLEQNLADLKAQKAVEEADLAELTKAYPELLTG